MRPVSMRPVLSAVAAATCLVAMAGQAGQAPADPAPDATITFRGRTAAVGVGFAWGGSTLEFQGRSYPVRVDGFVLGAVGTGWIEGVGRVRGLTKPQDLNGDFTALARGGAFGRGAGTIRMRNQKGVRIELDVTGSGFQLGAGMRGVTLSVGEAGGPPADASARLPQTLGFGELELGPLFLRPTLNAQVYFDAMHNAGFDGQWSFGPVDEVDHYLEHSNEAGLNLRYPLAEGTHGTVLGRISGLYSLTASGPDGGVCTGSDRSTSAYTLESGYLGWKSGNLLPALGFNGLELSGGNQNYQVADGLLFWDGGADCAGRGASWLSPRKAFHETGIARVTTKHFTLEGVHLKYNDHPDTHTRLGAGRVEYVTDDSFMEHLKLGFMYFHIYESETESRDGMDAFYVYHESTPLRVLPDLSFKASFVRESNSSSSGLSHATGWYVAPSYQLSSLPWKPRLGYRYASFSGGDTHAFDSLFTGLSEWGYWFQGELLGNYVLSNSNLISHQVRLSVEPNDFVTVNLMYYKFLLYDEAQSFGLTPSRLRS